MVVNEKEKEEFCNYIRMYRNNMFRIAMGVLQNAEDAQDAVSESIVNAYEHFDSLRDSAKFRPWIMRITLNEAYHLTKKRNHYDLWEDGIMPDFPAGNQNHELWEIVMQLEYEFRTIVILYYYEGFNNREIGKILSIPTGTVKSRLSRARSKLKNMIIN